MTRGISQARQNLLMALVALALAARVLVPVGWMPASVGGQPTITLCTGTGMVEAWIDADGKIHKSGPEQGGKMSGACVFCCLDLAFGAIVFAALALSAMRRTGVRPMLGETIAIGRGLAAPPPPARGPPILV